MAKRGVFGLAEQRGAFIAVAAVMALALIVPLAWVIAQSFGSDAGGFLDNYLSVLGKKRLLRVLAHSFAVSGLVALISTTIAFFAAYFLWACRFPKALSLLFKLILLTAFFFPSITYGFAVIYSFGRQGLITSFLGQLPFSIYGFNGLLIAGTVYCMPFAFMLLQNAFLYVSRDARTVCEILGDGLLRIFWMTALRPIAGSLCAAFLLTFFLNFTDFGIPSSVAGRYEVISVMLYSVMMGAIPDFGRGAVIAVLMLAPSVLAVVLLRAASRLNFISEPGSSQRRPGALLQSLGAGYLTLVSLALLSVFAVIFVVPFVQSWPYQPYFTLDTIRRLLADDAVSSSYLNSLKVAALTALFGVMFCYAAALASVRSALPRWAGVLMDFFAMLTNTVPGMVLGVGFMFAFSGTFMMNSFALIVLCNIVHFFTTPYLMCSDALSRMNRGYEITCALMGDSYFQALRRVIVPNSFLTLCSVASYLFINAMVTISAVIFLCGAHTQVMTTRIRELQYFERFDAIFVLSLLIFITNVAVKILFDLLPRAVPKIRDRMRRLKQPRAAGAALNLNARQEA